MQTPAPAHAQTTAFEHCYPGEAEQIGFVRADLAAVLSGCPALNDVLLIASEFSTNAITHSQSGQPGGMFTVRAEIHAGKYVWIEAEDEGGGWDDPGHHDRMHGLGVVDALAGDGNWGVDGDGAYGRIVWARLDWHGAA